MYKRCVRTDAIPLVIGQTGRSDKAFKIQLTRI